MSTVKENAMKQCDEAIEILQVMMGDANREGNQVLWLALQAAYQRAVLEQQFWTGAVSQ